MSGFGDLLDHHSESYDPGAIFDRADELRKERQMRGEPNPYLAECKCGHEKALHTDVQSLAPTACRRSGCGCARFRPRLVTA